MKFSVTKNNLQTLRRALRRSKHPSEFNQQLQGMSTEPLPHMTGAHSSPFSPEQTLKRYEDLSERIHVNDVSLKKGVQQTLKTFGMNALVPGRYNIGIHTYLANLNKIPSVMIDFILNHFKQLDSNQYRGNSSVKQFPFPFARHELLFPFTSLTQDNDALRIDITTESHGLDVKIASTVRVGMNGPGLEQVTMMRLEARGNWLSIAALDVLTDDIDTDRFIKQGYLNTIRLAEKVKEKLPLFKHEKSIIKDLNKDPSLLLESLGIYKNSLGKQDAHISVENKSISRQLETLEGFFNLSPQALLRCNDYQLKGLYDVLEFANNENASIKQRKDNLRTQLTDFLLKKEPRLFQQTVLKDIPSTARLPSWTLKTILKKRKKVFGKRKHSKDIKIIHVTLARQEKDAVRARRLLKLPVKETGWRRIKFLSKLFKPEASKLNISASQNLALIKTHKALTVPFLRQLVPTAEAELADTALADFVHHLEASEPTALGTLLAEIGSEESLGLKAKVESISYSFPEEDSPGMSAFAEVFGALNKGTKPSGATAASGEEVEVDSKEEEVLSRTSSVESLVRVRERDPLLNKVLDGGDTTSEHTEEARGENARRVPTHTH